VIFGQGKTAPQIETILRTLIEHGQGGLVTRLDPAAASHLKTAFPQGVHNATARTFRVANGDTNDFVPAQGTPGMFLPRDVELFGGQAASSWRGLNVAGSYGDALIIEEDTIQAGYVLGLASGGAENLGNPVGLRQHSNVSLQGLRLVKGPNPDYPLIDSFYNRGFGTGIRQRGGAFVMQITASATYTAPTF
jgi:hypothetical protein